MQKLINWHTDYIDRMEAKKTPVTFSVRRHLFRSGSEKDPRHLFRSRGVSDYLGPLAMDGKVKMLEDKLEGLIIDFARAAGETRLRRRREQELPRIMAEQERIRHEREVELKRRQEALEERRSEEAAMITQLFEHAQGWQRGKLLREYLDALCFYRVGEREVVGIDSELAKYLRWGFEQTDRSDPLRPTPPPVLDEEVDDSDLEWDENFRPREAKKTLGIEKDPRHLFRSPNVIRC